MKNISYVIVCICSLLFLGCASIPPTTVTLTQEIIKEADEMHQLNIILVNQLFEERKQVINAFITNEYTPTIIKKYEALLPDSLDYKKALPNIMKSVIPVINRKKDSLQNVLSDQQQNIITSLNTNYVSYSKATIALQQLINSAVKLKKAENNALSSIQDLTGDSVDVKKVESTIDGLLIKTGTDMSKLLEVNNILKLN
ncbi:hypothetical protein [Lacinutrix sp. Hel_I_90]|uniref:hypothetical protein n=1 Tax=Lacinutrix sp. Hel_I_90 TaxID=1249999 RepID=UPI0005CB7725|nr:hypothetical protein [Lacinutrix sp. Hel_I_90]